MRTNIKLLAGAALLSCIVAGLALAQTYIPAPVPTIGTTDLFQDVPAGNGAVPEVFATPAQIAGVPGFIKAAPATGFTLTFGNSTTDMILNPAGTLATGTLITAANPSNGQRECVLSSQTQTALTVTANTGQSINNAPTSLTANVPACWTYSLANATWDRSP